MDPLAGSPSSLSPSPSINLKHRSETGGEPIVMPAADRYMCEARWSVVRRQTPSICALEDLIGVRSRPHKSDAATRDMPRPRISLRARRPAKSTVPRCAADSLAAMATRPVVGASSARAGAWFGPRRCRGGHYRSVGNLFGRAAVALTNATRGAERRNLPLAWKQITWPVRGQSEMNICSYRSVCSLLAIGSALNRP